MNRKKQKTKQNKTKTRNQTYAIFRKKASTLFLLKKKKNEIYIELLTEFKPAISVFWLGDQQRPLCVT